jgi:flagellar basal body rod protein FlgB
MLKSLFGPTTVSSMLRGGLEETSATHRAIAERVARLLNSSSNVDFADELAKKAAEGRVDEEALQRDMAALADTQLRYEADAKLLQEAYGRLRVAMKDRG